MRPWLLLPLAAAAWACERDPMDRTDDLWPGLRRAPATALPTSDDISAGCFQATMHFKAEVEKTPGDYVDVDYVDLFVRKPQCRWEPGSASTALCRFELTSLDMGQPEAQRRESLAYLERRPWDRHEARMVFVGRRWIVPQGCARLPEPAPSSG